MHDFQWVVTGFLMQHLQGRLIALLLVLLAVIVVTGVFVAKELRKDRTE